ncbi:hypothetical protein NA57DRAFT_60774 [Rhizodiscina lignyota]|uniref:Uncharacterized protein n=1 Tax=Rhizodiscina lignyota TaxID=1504668 RepID=A0A9P4M5T2_9PEZI|nr:hypothetical protein NA57DRAFT_60774 [Rhizodiscina lignyota]
MKKTKSEHNPSLISEGKVRQRTKLRPRASTSTREHANLAATRIWNALTKFASLLYGYDDDNDLCGELVKTKLNQTVESISYEAISYSWVTEDGDIVKSETPVSDSGEGLPAVQDQKLCLCSPPISLSWRSPPPTLDRRYMHLVKLTSNTVFYGLELFGLSRSYRLQ